MFSGRNTTLVACAMLASLGTRAQELPVRDPMRPFQAEVAGAAEAAARAPRFVLTAVLIAPQRRVAVVNGRPRRLGDHVDGAEITLIEPHAVHLRDGSDEIVVRLRGTIRTAVAGNEQPASVPSAAAATTAPGDPGL